MVLPLPFRAHAFGAGREVLARENETVLASMKASSSRRRGVLASKVKDSFDVRSMPCFVYRIPISLHTKTAEIRFGGQPRVWKRSPDEGSPGADSGLQ